MVLDGVAVREEKGKAVFRTPYTGRRFWLLSWSKTPRVCLPAMCFWRSEGLSRAD